MVGILVRVALVGAGATLLIDGWALLRRRLFGTPLPDYRLVGRWVAYLPRGILRHAPIGATPPVRFERAIGWATHYTVGIAFAAILLAIAGPRWLQQPALAPALAVGIASVLAPFLVMQPCMGAGIASRRLPDPAAARRRTLATHAAFALGLYVAGWAVWGLFAFCSRVFST